MSKAKKKKGLGVANAVVDLKEKMENKDKNIPTITDDKMKITYLNVNTLTDYPDNEEWFGNLSGEEFEDLCRSIDELGVLQPAIVRPTKDGESFEILAGHQRKRASIKVGKVQIPTIVRYDLVDDDVTSRLIWLDTNIKGRKLTQSQLARAINEELRLLDVQVKEGKLEIKGKKSKFVADKYGFSSRKVEDLASMARNLIDSILDSKMTASSMKELAKLNHEEQEAIVKILGHDALESMKKKEVEAVVQEYKGIIEETSQSFNENINELKSSISAKEKAVSEAKKEAEQFKNKMMKAEKLKHDMINKIADLEEEIDKSKDIELLDELKKKKFEIEGELENLDENYKRLEKESKQKDNKLKELDGELVKYEKKLKDLSNKYTDTLTENNEMKKKLKDLVNIEDKLKKLQETTSINVKLDSAIKNLTLIEIALYDIMNNDINLNEYEARKNLFVQKYRDIGSLIKKLK